MSFVHRRPGPGPSLFFDGAAREASSNHDELLAVSARLAKAAAETLCRHDTVYARRYRSHPVTSWAGLRNLLEHGGFAIDRPYPSETAKMAGGHQTTVPTLSGDDTDYAHILCSRG